MSGSDDEQISPDEVGDEVSAEELREAEELARVLDGGRLDSEPGEALEAAALLRVSHQPELDPERQQQLLSELLTQQEQKRLSSTRQPIVPTWFRWLWLAVPAAAGGFALFQAVGGQQEMAAQVAEQSAAAPPAAAEDVQSQPATAPRRLAQSDRQESALPEPSRRLLQLQSSVLQGTPGEASEDFERELNAYRGEVFAALEARYR